MPRVIAAETEESCALGDLIEKLETSNFDPRDEDGFASWATDLKKLANNRTFLAELMIDELKRRCADQVRDNQYSAQVVMLHASRQKFILRANFWPAMKDSVIRHSGTDPFFYHVPHDHNFSFLTVGYLGPGYWSEYYEYDYGTVVGVPGEPVDLRFVEKAKLDEGKVMLYRAHRDVHNQLPADEMSVSLNILETSHAATFRDQYRFDLAQRRIDGIMTSTSLEPMLALAAHFGGEEGTDLLAEFAAHHPSERIRWCALRSRAGAAPDIDARISLFEGAAAGSSPLVAGMARREIGRLEAGRTWIDGAPLATVSETAAA